MDELTIPDSFEELSKINSAGMVNMTLNNLWSDFFRHFRNGEYLGANSDLDCIWTILGGEKEIEGKDTEKNYLAIEKKLSESGNLQNSIQVKGFGKIDEGQISKVTKQKKILLEKSLYLRRLQNRQGKGTAYYKEDEGDFD